MPYIRIILPQTDDFMAVILEVLSRDLDYFVKRIARPGTGITEEEVRSVYSALEKEIREVTEEGDGVNLSICQARPSIQGVFYNESESFDPARHKLVSNLIPGEVITEALKKVKLVKVPATIKGPVIQAFIDVRTKTRNTQITPGKIGKLKGVNLKVDTADEQQGIFFIDQNNQEIKVEVFSHNLPSDVTFEIPDTLTAGHYRIEVRTLLAGNKKLKKGTLDATLQVA